MQCESWSRKPHNFSQHLFTFLRTRIQKLVSYLAVRPTGRLLLLSLKLHPFMAPERGKVKLECETFTQLHHNTWILVICDEYGARNQYKNPQTSNTCSLQLHRIEPCPLHLVSG